MNGGEQTRRVYQVPGIRAPAEGWQKKNPQAPVDCFPWGAQMKDDFRPASSAWMAANDTSLRICMETGETGLRAEERGFSGEVYTDSCMELFLMPDPAHSPNYLNWEFNPAGAMYLSLGTSRFDRVDVPEEDYRELFQVKTRIHAGGWRLEYAVPLSFLRRFFPLLELKPGHVMRGNFYKCGDKTARPHFGCWSPIDLPKPDFHCPDFFGSMLLA
jgi:hypothetical protein